MWFEVKWRIFYDSFGFLWLFVLNFILTIKELAFVRCKQCHGCEAPSYLLYIIERTKNRVNLGQFLKRLFSLSVSSIKNSIKNLNIFFSFFCLFQDFVTLKLLKKDLVQTFLIASEFFAVKKTPKIALKNFIRKKASFFINSQT